MKKGLYVIYDVGAQQASSIVEATTDRVASRIFANAIKHSPYLDEFVLYKIGDFVVHDGDNPDFELVFSKPEIIETDLDYINKIRGGNNNETA